MKPVLRQPASTVDFSPEGDRFLWGGGNLADKKCPLAVCDVETGKPIFPCEGHRKPLVQARFLSDGSIVSFSFDSHVVHWDADGTMRTSNDTHLSHRADGFDVSADGKLAVTGDYRGGISGWTLKTGKQAFAFLENNSKGQIWSLALSPNGKQLVTGGAEGVVRLWDVAKKKVLNAVTLGRGHHVQGLAWNGDRIAAAIEPDGSAEKGAKSRVLIYEAKTFEELLSISTAGNQPYCCRFSADGRRIAAGGGGTDRGGNESKANCVIRVWDVETGEETGQFAGHTGLVRDLAFSPDGKWLLFAGWDDKVRAWEL